MEGCCEHHVQPQLCVFALHICTRNGQPVVVVPSSALTSPSVYSVCRSLRALTPLLFLCRRAGGGRTEGGRKKTLKAYVHMFFLSHIWLSLKQLYALPIVDFWNNSHDDRISCYWGYQTQLFGDTAPCSKCELKNTAIKLSQALSVWSVFWCRPTLFYFIILDLILLYISNSCI